MVLYFFYNESIYKEGVYMIIFRLVLVALLGFVLFNLYRVLTHKPRVKGSCC